MSLSQDLETCNLFFVYGTLRIGFSNHRVLGTNRLFRGDAVTEDNYYMLGYGVPIIIPGGDKKVFGELYQVRDEATLRDLDQLEGHPTFYKREIIKVKDEDGNIKDAWCYIYTREVDHIYPHLTEVEGFGSVQQF